MARHIDDIIRAGHDRNVTVLVNKSGIGRETHEMALGHYQQTKNVLMNVSTDPLGFF